MRNHDYFSGRVVFDHLPKTAGQSINYWLSSELGSGSITPNLIGNHQELIRSYGGIYTIISGHITFHPGEQLDPRYTYITLLREPVDRCISWLFYLMHDVIPTPDTQNLIDGANLFFESDGRETNHEFLSGVSNIYVEHFSRIISTNELDSEHKLLTAYSAVNCYDVVGTYEHMPLFPSAVAELLDIPTPEAIPKINVTSKKLKPSQVSSALRERLIELNSLDIQLYQKICASIYPPTHPKNGFITKPRWRKYERLLNRVVTTPVVPAIYANVREGNLITQGQFMTFEVKFLLTQPVPDLVIGIHIFDSNKSWAFGTNSTMQGLEHRNISAGINQFNFHMIVDLPAGKYTAGFSVSEKHSLGLNELAWFDVLYDFQVFRNDDTSFVGYSYVPLQICMSPTIALGDESIVEKPVGKIRVTAPLKTLPASASILLTVCVENRGNENWKGDPFRPVNLTYHWTDMHGKYVIFGGLRTSLPPDGIAPGQEIGLEMQINVPDEPGTYKLILTLVQETVSWFEDRGFEPEMLDVVVE